MADIKKIICKSDLGSKISHVLVVQLETFTSLRHKMARRKSLDVLIKS